MSDVSAKEDMRICAQAAAEILSELAHGSERGPAQIELLGDLHFQVAMEIDGGLKVERMGDVMDSYVWDVVYGVSVSAAAMPRGVRLVRPNVAEVNVTHGLFRRAVKLYDWTPESVTSHCWKLNIVTAQILRP